MSDDTYDGALAQLAEELGERLGEPIAVLRGTQRWAAIISRERNGFFCWHSVDEGYDGQPFAIQGYYRFRRENDARADALHYLLDKAAPRGSRRTFLPGRI